MHGLTTRLTSLRGRRLWIWDCTGISGYIHPMCVGTAGSCKTLAGDHIWRLPNAQLQVRCDCGALQMRQALVGSVARSVTQHNMCLCHGRTAISCNCTSMVMCARQVAIPYNLARLARQERLDVDMRAVRDESLGTSSRTRLEACHRC